MRPAGEIRQALLQACMALATPDRGATLREIAQHAQVGLSAARKTVANMKQAGALQIARDRRVAYRNRPVAEYVPAAWTPPQQSPAAGLASVLTTWVG